MRRRRLDLVLDPTSRCNIRCIMCYFSVVDRIRFKPFDHDPDPRGNMSVAMIRHIASELFPTARSVGLGCSAEPLLHPRLGDILEQTRTHRVPFTWIQTNLLALTAATARAIVSSGVKTVAVSIDGMSRNTYEKIRRSASWDRLHERLDLLRTAKAEARSVTPRLRITFAWMRSNRNELARLPEFAADRGASEIDVRFVAPTVGVDNSRELLSLENPESVMAELWSVAREATRRGIRLSAYPTLRHQDAAGDSVINRLRRRLWKIKSGIDGPRIWRHSFFERLDGCAFPGRTLLIRPNGAVLPCPFWEEQPVALVPRDDRTAILKSPGIADIRHGLRHGCPVGSCRTCTQKRNALFRFAVARPAPSGRPECGCPAADAHGK